MASIEKRNGGYRVRVSYKDANGKRKQLPKDGFKTMREARAWAVEAEKKALEGTLSKDSDTPLAEYFWNWYRVFKEPTVRPRTKLSYEQVHSVLKEYFGRRTLGQIDRTSYQEFLNEYGKNHAKSTVSKNNALIHAAVKNALYDGVIYKDFVANTTVVFDRSKTRQIEYINISDMKKLLFTIHETLDPHFTSKFMIATAFIHWHAPW